MWITRNNHLRMSRLTILGAIGIPQQKSVIRRGGVRQRLPTLCHFGIVLTGRCLTALPALDSISIEGVGSLLYDWPDHLSCGSTSTLEELSMRQGILETAVAASFEVDGVLAELDNERAHLSELSATLQARRDRAVNLINAANLVTGILPGDNLRF